MIPYGRQNISSEDVDAVMRVLQGDWLTQGPSVAAFEQAMAGYCGAQHAVAVCNGTAGLHLACLALNLGPGDRLWTSVNTFVASANCARYCGAEVDFIDIDPRTYNLSIEALSAKLESAERQSCLPKIVVAVHFAGQSCPMRELRELADRYGFRIIEDAAHALGAYYLDDRIGACRYADITTFSFHPVKLITTGEGGMVLTNQQALRDRLMHLRSHGIERAPTRAGEGGWYYEQTELGHNYRLTDIQAALGLSQLERIDEFLERRHEQARRYHATLKGLPLVLPWQDPDGVSAYHLFPVQVESADRKAIYDELHARGIQVNVHYIPMHHHPYYQKRARFADGYPEAERYYRRVLSLPIHPSLTVDQHDEVIGALNELLH